MNPTEIDIASLRLDQGFTQTSDVVKVFYQIPIGRPPKQDFFRSHPDAAFRFPAAIIEDENNRSEVFIVDSRLINELEGEWKLAILTPIMNRQNELTIWPVKQPVGDRIPCAWHTSALQASVIAKDVWVRMTSNMRTKSYDVYQAPAQHKNNWPDPVWPDMTMEELIDIAFRGRVIDSLDHPLVKQLRGL